MKSLDTEQSGTVSKGVRRGQPTAGNSCELQALFGLQENGFGLTVPGSGRSVRIGFSRVRFSMKKGDRLCKKIFRASLAVLWPVAAAVGQPHQDPSQPSQQSSSQAQSQPEQKKKEAGGGAAKKSEKEKAKPKKVYTEEDLSGMRGNDVSIVGDEKLAGDAAGAKKADRKTTTVVVPMSGRDEAYWRGKARVLLDQIAATEQQIAKLKGDIKKYGAGGFDVTTGMRNSVAYIEDRNGQVKDLERKKADLEKKLDQLQEEGRKAGAEPAWFR